MLGNLTMAVTLKAYDQMSRVVRSVTSKSMDDFRRLQEQVKKVSSGMQQAGGMAMGAGVAMGAALAVPVKTAMGFQDAMAKVGAISQASQTDMARLTEQARALGRDTVFSASQAAEGMSYLAMAGFKTNDVISAMPGMLNLAAAGGLDLASSADIASNILSGFGKQASESTRVADVLARTFTTSNTSLVQLGEGMKYVAPIAKTLGVSLEETSAMMGLLGDVGIQGSMAGTVLAAGFTRLATEPKMAAKELAAFGISTMDAAGRMKSMPALLTELAKATEKLGSGAKTAALARIFGMEAVKGFAPLLDAASSGTLQKKVADISGNATGTGARIAQQMNDTAGGAMRTMLSSLEDLAIQAGNHVLPVLTQTFNKIAEGARSVTAWAKAHPGLTKGILLTVAGASAFLVVGGGLLLTLGTMGHVVAGTIGGMIKFAEVMTLVKTRALGSTVAVKTLALHQQLMSAIQYRGGFWPALQHQLLLTRYRMMEAVGSARAWTVAQLAAFRANFLTIGGLRAMAASLAGSVVTGLKGAAVAARAFAVSLLANPITWIAVAVVGAGLLIYKYWKPISGFFVGLFEGIKQGAAPLAPAFKQVGAAFAPVIAPLRAAWGWVTRLLKPVDDVNGGAKSLGVTWGKTIGGMLVSSAGFVAKLIGFGVQIAGGVYKVLSTIVGFYAKVYGTIFNAGRTMVEMLVKGIMSLATKPAETMKGVVQRIRNLLPFSPAKDGPLRDLHRIKLVETLATSVKPGPLVTAMTRATSQARQAVVPAMTGGLAGAGAGRPGGGAGVSITYSPTITIQGGSPQAKEEFAQMLRAHAHELRRIVRDGQAKAGRAAY